MEQYRFNPGNTCYYRSCRLDGSDPAPRARSITDQGSICSERSRSSSGNQSSIYPRRVSLWAGIWRPFRIWYQNKMVCIFPPSVKPFWDPCTATQKRAKKVLSYQPSALERACMTVTAQVLSCVSHITLLFHPQDTSPTPSSHGGCFVFSVGYRIEGFHVSKYQVSNFRYIVSNVFFPPSPGIPMFLFRYILNERFHVIKFRNIDFSIYRNPRVSSSVTWHPRVFYADAERKLHVSNIEIVYLAYRQYQYE